MIDFLILLGLLLVNGVLAASELSIVSARRARLQGRADAGDARAGTVLELAAEPDRFLSTVQIGITLIGIVAGAFGGTALVGPVGAVLARVPLLAPYAGTVASVLVVALITYLSLVIGELVPKRLALMNPEAVALIVARPMRVLSRVAAPLVSLLAFTSNLLLRVLGAHESKEPPVTEEEVELLLQEGAQHGVFAESERVLVQGVFDLGDRRAAELMTPRHRVVALDLTVSDAENRERIRSSGRSEFPVCDGGLDKIVGLVSLKLLWDRAAAPAPLALAEVMTAPMFVPASAPVLGVLERFQQTDVDLAVVLDEYGGMKGLLGLDDVVAAIAGNLGSPLGEDHEEATRRDDGSWLLGGSLAAHEARELLALNSLPGEEDGAFETLAGFLLARLQQIPASGESVEWDGWRFEIVDMDGNRIDKVLATPAPPTVDPSEPV